ncbi:hypothetical protein JHK87_055442 [Glycine soja]|nr:hypothetical protein JHK87_055442 [Glycine soja]
MREETLSPNPTKGEKERLRIQSPTSPFFLGSNYEQLEPIQTLHTLSLHCKGPFSWAALSSQVRSGANAAEIYSLAFSSTAQYSALSSNGLHTFLAQFEAAIDSDFPNYQLETYAVLRSIPNGPNRHTVAGINSRGANGVSQGLTSRKGGFELVRYVLLKKKAFYIDSNGLSTSVTTRGGNTVSLNTDIGWRTVFEGRPFYIGCVAQLM